MKGNHVSRQFQTEMRPTRVGSSQKHVGMSTGTFCSEEVCGAFDNRVCCATPASNWLADRR